ncbi:MAG: HNH endonuclease signature motif containing protein, partial [Mycobacterium sp.]
AQLRTVTHPGAAAPEPRYTPSRALADFIRCRDLTCRFPGCDAPATDADIDHTVPYPVGPTHASNCKCLCRFHHLLKTFWTGENGWHDRQLPDGTIIWTSPTGHTYTTHPAGAALFPALSPPTAALWDGDPPHNININTNTDQRGAMMPRRRHTRAQNRAHTITTERRLNDDLVTEHNKPPPF